MNRPPSLALKGIGFAAVALYAAVFPVLAIDTIVKAVQWQSLLETRTLALILLLEASKAMTGIVALGVGVALVARRRRPGTTALACGLLFAALTFAKILGSGGFPGPAQEWLARTLLGAGVPRALLAWLFGPSAWPAWPAAAALLHFSSVFPARLLPSALDASGRADRRGLLRGSGLAGADVGAHARAFSNRLLAAHAFNTTPLAIFAALMVAAHTSLEGTPGRLLIWGAGAATAGLLITNLWAAHSASAGGERASLGWIAEGFIVSLFLFLVAAAMVALLPSPPADLVALALIGLAPAIIVAGFALAALRIERVAARPSLSGTIAAGSLVFALTVIAGLVFAATARFTRGWAASEQLAALGAAVAAASAWRPVKRFTERIRLTMPERSRENA